MARYSSVYAVPVPVPQGRLSIISRPRGNDWLDDELRALRYDGVTHVVSLLEPAEASDLGLTDEAAAAQRQGLRCTNIPVRDRSVPSDPKAFRDHAFRLAQSIRDGESLGIHCRQSVGRSSLLTIAILRHLGLDLDTAIARVQGARGLPIPETPEQLAWLRQAL
ncbi:MAG: tyrosine protein phosphatase [Myxococcota bacterium]